MSLITEEKSSIYLEESSEEKAKLETVKVFHVDKKMRDGIPKTLKVYRVLSEKNWENKWSKSYSVYELESIKPDEVYQDYLKVTYRLRKSPLRKITKSVRELF